jgi:hypothetical protein
MIEFTGLIIPGVQVSVFGATFKIRREHNNAANTKNKTLPKGRQLLFSLPTILLSLFSNLSLPSG